MTPEGYVKKAVKDLLNAEHIPWWPMQSGKVKSQFGGWVQLCATGTADLLAAPLVSSHSHVWSDFLWIECKALGKSATPKQLEFADFVRQRGHHWLELDDVKILQDWLRENRAR